MRSAIVWGNDHGWTPLHLAARSNPEALESLVKANDDGATALSLASGHNVRAVIQTLLNAGAKN